MYVYILLFFSKDSGIVDIPTLVYPVPMKDLRILPKIRDSLTFLYVEHCKIDQEHKAIAIHDMTGRVPVPCATLSVLMIGPGVSITHAAIMSLSEAGCLVMWCGEEGVRFYAQGLGEAGRSDNLLHQAAMWADADKHLEVAIKMYQMRFTNKLPPDLTLRQIRGMEGIRVRTLYEDMGRKTGIKLNRKYNKKNWDNTTPINRALSAANACLYGICHAAIVSTGFSPAIGFVHTGKPLSFVYDIADLYKAETTIPVAFDCTALGEYDLERIVRLTCRDYFRTSKIMKRIVPDIEYALGLRKERKVILEEEEDKETGIFLWDPELGTVEGERNYAEEMIEVNFDDDSGS